MEFKLPNAGYLSFILLLTVIEHIQWVYNSTQAIQ